MSAIQSKLNHAIEKARASVNPTQANLDLLVESQGEIERLAAKNEKMAELLKVFAFFAEKMPEPTIGETDWHGMAKEARDLTQADPQALAKIENEWWVVSTILTKGWLMLQCRVTGKRGFVKDPTKAEWGTAFYAPSNPYLWHDTSRVEAE